MMDTTIRQSQLGAGQARGIGTCIQPRCTAPKGSLA
jgi:hypothetical protein